MYNVPVKFSVTNTYGCHPEGEDDVYTIEGFLEYVKVGSFIDYDGWGHPVKGGLSDEAVVIKPSRIDKIPSDATHVVWYNR